MATNYSIIFELIYNLLDKWALGASEDDAERGEENCVGYDRGHLGEGLAVGDDEARRIGEGVENVLELVRLADMSRGIVVEDVADDLHLRENHASFGCRRVDRSNQHYMVALRNDVAKQ